MELKISARKGKSKSEISAIRRQGNIPAVIYSKGKEGINVTVDGSEFNACLRHLEKGGLPTVRFKLKGEDGKATEALVKEVQYHPTTYDVNHLDFVALEENQPLNVKVPIRLIGAAECTGVKLGGFLRQIIRHLKVKCLPKDIPTSFSLDVTELGIRQSLRLADLKIPESIRPLTPLKEVVATVSKR